MMRILAHFLLIASWIVFLAGCASSTGLRRGISSEAQNLNDKLCFDLARYQASVTPEQVEKTYSFRSILGALYRLDAATNSIIFEPSYVVPVATERRALQHAYLYLSEWRRRKCFSEQQAFQNTFKNIKEALLIEERRHFPGLNDSELLALVQFNPWHAKDFPSIADSSSKSLLEVLIGEFGVPASKTIFEIFQNYGFAIHVQKADRREQGWLTNNLQLISDEFKRFDRDEPGRFKRVLPSFRILEIYFSERSDDSGGATFHGIKLGLTKQTSYPAKVWILWHEIGHVFDKQRPENSDYITSNYCSSPANGPALRASDRLRRGKLKAFGDYSDFFSSPESPDEYRRKKNYQLVSYFCEADGLWGEALRQSHYNRSPGEQFADDFAHFVMYPPRFFFHEKMVAPETFRFFETHLGGNYLGSYADIFKGTSRYSIELRLAEFVQSIWPSYEQSGAAENRAKVNFSFTNLKSAMTDPIPD